MSSAGFCLGFGSCALRSSLSFGTNGDGNEETSFLISFDLAGVVVSDSEELPGNPGVGLSTRLT